MRRSRVRSPSAPPIPLLANSRSTPESKLRCRFSPYVLPARLPWHPLSYRQFGGRFGGNSAAAQGVTAMLSASAVRDAKPQAAAHKLRDGRGLYLLVQPNGSRWWRFDYRRPGTGKRNTLSLGTYPDVSLKRAREKRDDARMLLADGIDPGDKRKAETQAGAETFEAVAREWFAKFSTRWAASHAGKVIARLERDLFPWIGSKPIAALAAPDVLAVLRRIESRGAIETAHRALQ